MLKKLKLQILELKLTILRNIYILFDYVTHFPLLTVNMTVFDGVVLKVYLSHTLQLPKLLGHKV